MNQDFIASLELAGLGMGAVIVALLIIALIIMALGHVGRSSNKTSQIEPEPAPEKDVALELTPSTANQSDEAAAIAIALVLQRQRSASGLKRHIDYSDSEVIGEVVNVVGIDTGTGAWASAGRLQSIR
ncbi:MAG: OadG family protein [Chloroflexi bacterium]|nr:OadG family protein [Chloroflexota bacterium]